MKKNTLPDANSLAQQHADYHSQSWPQQRFRDENEFKTLTFWEAIKKVFKSKTPTDSENKTLPAESKNPAIVHPKKAAASSSLQTETSPSNIDGTFKAHADPTGPEATSENLFRAPSPVQSDNAYEHTPD